MSLPGQFDGVGFHLCFQFLLFYELFLLLIQSSDELLDSVDGKLYIHPLA